MMQTNTSAPNSRAAVNQSNNKGVAKGAAFNGGWAETLLTGKEPKQIYGTKLDGTYLGHQDCHFIKGKQNTICSEIAQKQIEKFKDTKNKRRPTAVTVTVSTDGINFVFGASEAARFFVAVRDVASMSLCPKGKSGKLKIASVLCRSSARRMHNLQVPGPKGSELEMICHVWRPKDSPALWDFYASFEAMLKNRGVVDPYLQQAIAPVEPDPSEQKFEARDAAPASMDIMSHFDKTDVERLEDRIDHSVKTARASKVSVAVHVPNEDADSDIEIDFSDDEDDDAGDSSDDDDTDDSTGLVAKVVTLGCDDDIQSEASC
eukprot:m.229114 g.229114  ORF g.229114 m.229114 type:complete len:318 (-) comp33552_c3_seq7:78-1031(-)